MPLLACNFCTHGNPEGSKFCNECGSPLHLAPCSQCQAINSASDTQCFRCGAPLSVSTKEEMLAPAMADAENSLATTDSVPTAFADRLDTLPWDLRAPPTEPSVTVEDRPPVAVTTAAGPTVDNDDRPFDPSDWLRATNSGRPSLAPRLFLGVAVVAVAGVAYWMSVNSTRSPDPGTVDTAPAAGPGPAPGAPAAPSQAADTQAETRESPPANSSPTAGPVTQPAEASQSPPTPRESISPSAEAGAPASKQTSASPDAQSSSRTNSAQSAVGKTAKTTTPRPAIDTRSSTVTQARTPEQAERDALATRRLIERELGNSPRAESTNSEPSPGQ
jgi:hypothetical protein